MKVSLVDYEIYDYVLSLRIEVEGQKYLADLRYGPYDGYQVSFRNDKGEAIDYPEWAVKIDQDSWEDGDCLGYILETSIGKRLDWVDYSYDIKGECDTCGIAYDPGSQLDHCGECGNCWNHCQEKVGA